MTRKKSSDSTRRKVLKGSSAVVAGTALGGCIGGDSGNSDSVRILSYEPQEQVGDVYDDLADQFEEDTGTPVEVDYVPTDAFADRLSTELRGNDVPEITTGTLSLNAGRLLDADELEPVTDVIDDLAEGDVGQMPDGIIPTVDGEDWAVPYAIKLYYTTIREDHMNDAGFDLPSDPYDVDYSNFSDWVQGMDEEHDDASGFTYSYAAEGRGSFFAMHLLWTNGVHIFNGEFPDHYVSLDEDPYRERAIEALEWLDQDIEPHSLSMADGGWSDIGSAFSLGEASSVFYDWGGNRGDFVANGNEDALPDVQPIQYPMNQTRDDGHINRASVQAFGVLSRSDNPELGKDLIRTLLQSDVYYDFLHARPLHLFPPTVELARSDAYNDNEWVQDYQHIRDFQIELLEEDHAFAPPLAVGGFNAAFSTMYTSGDLGRMVGRVVTDEMDPGEAVDAAAADIREYLN